MRRPSRRPLEVRVSSRTHFHGGETIRQQPSDNVTEPDRLKAWAFPLQDAHDRAKETIQLPPTAPPVPVLDSQDDDDQPDPPPAPRPEPQRNSGQGPASRSNADQGEGRDGRRRQPRSQGKATTTSTQYRCAQTGGSRSDPSKGSEATLKQLALWIRRWVANGLEESIQGAMEEQRVPNVLPTYGALCGP
jgi:hypothetical protein